MTVRRRQFLELGGLAAVLAVAGCARHESGTPTVSRSTTGSSQSGPSTGDVVTASGAPSAAGDVAELRGTGRRGTGADPGAARRPLASFAARLFRAAAPGTDNAVVSPYSVLAALGMTQYAARGEAADAMASALGGDADTVAGWLTAVDAAVATAVAAGTKNSSGAPVHTAVDAANSLFAQRGLPVRQQFLNELVTGYGAGLRTCDFAADPDGCRAAINDWVAQRTHHLINHLLPAQSLNTTTRLVLVNALYLSAAWGNEFNLGATSHFATPSGTVTAPYLGITEDFGHVAADGWSAVTVPYAGGGLAMTVLLPDKGGFDDVARGMDAALFAAATAGASRRVTVRMPPFSGTTAVSLKHPLTGMGLGPIFGGDFSGVTGRAGDVTVADVIHQARIDVDEHGTKAAAATAVIGVAGTAPGGQEPDPIEFVADRPFLYWIHDGVTGFPLFLGRVTDPTR